MSDIKKDLILCFLLENYCDNNDYDFTKLYNKLKENNNKNIDYNKNTIDNKILTSQITIKNNENDISITNDNKERLTNYIIEKNIGNGSFGSVYKCINTIDKQSYALKLVKFNINQNILREVRLMATLEHPNIIKYYCSWIDKSPNINDILKHENDSNTSSYSNDSIVQLNTMTNYYLFIQMELCTNSLTQYLELEKFNYNIRISIFKDIIKGLDYLHENNIIHRDIKPSNILFSKNGVIKISDFGMSIKHESILNKDFVGSDIFGTYLYTSPLSLKENIYSKYTDIYSVGIILYELLNNFNTIMEKTKEINFLKYNYKYPDIFTINYSNESKFILKLLKHSLLTKDITNHI